MLLMIVPDGLGNVSLVFVCGIPDACVVLTVKHDGKIIATLLYDEDDVPQTVNDNPTMTEVSTLLEDKKLSLICSNSVK